MLIWVVVIVIIVCVESFRVRIEVEEERERVEEEEEENDLEQPQVSSVHGGLRRLFFSVSLSFSVFLCFFFPPSFFEFSLLLITSFIIPLLGWL